MLHSISYIFHQYSTKTWENTLLLSPTARETTSFAGMISTKSFPAKYANCLRSLLSTNIPSRKKQTVHPPAVRIFKPNSSRFSFSLKRLLLRTDHTVLEKRTLSLWAESRSIQSLIVFFINYTNSFANHPDCIHFASSKNSAKFIALFVPKL